MTMTSPATTRLFLHLQFSFCISLKCIENLPLGFLLHGYEFSDHKLNLKLPLNEPANVSELQGCAETFIKKDKLQKLSAH